MVGIHKKHPKESSRKLLEITSNIVVIDYKLIEKKYQCHSSIITMPEGKEF